MLPVFVEMGGRAIAYVCTYVQGDREVFGKNDASRELLSLVCPASVPLLTAASVLVFLPKTSRSPCIGYLCLHLQQGLSLSHDFRALLLLSTVSVCISEHVCVCRKPGFTGLLVLLQERRVRRDAAESREREDAYKAYSHQRKKKERAEGQRGAERETGAAVSACLCLSLCFTYSPLLSLSLPCSGIHFAPAVCLCAASGFPFCCLSLSLSLADRARREEQERQRETTSKKKEKKSVYFFAACPNACSLLLTLSLLSLHHPASLCKNILSAATTLLLARRNNTPIRMYET